jgi:hypothetical protein
MSCSSIVRDSAIEVVSFGVIGQGKKIASDYAYIPPAMGPRIDFDLLPAWNAPSQHKEF